MSNPERPQEKGEQRALLKTPVSETGALEKAVLSPSLPGMKSAPVAYASVTCPDDLSLTAALFLGKDEGAVRQPASEHAVRKANTSSSRKEGGTNHPYTRREEVHAALQASGGCLFYGDAFCGSKHKYPRELWVWDTTIFMEIAYPIDPHDRSRFRVQGHLGALVNERWNTKESLQQTEQPGMSLQHHAFTENGHLVALWGAFAGTLTTIVSCVDVLRLHASSVSLEEMLSLSRPPHFLFGSEGRDAVHHYLEALYPESALSKHWKKVNTTLKGPCDRQGLRALCAQDDSLRGAGGASSEQLTESRRLYEQWMLWINEHSESVPPFIAPPSLGSMLALPSLLLSACADTHVQEKLDHVLAAMPPDALRAWWCTPDRMGKTGAQWFLSGMLGDGMAGRLYNVSLQQRQRNTSERVLASPLRSPLQTEEAETGSVRQRFQHQRLAWGTDLLQRITHKIGVHDEAWCSPTWSPAGIWFEALVVTQGRPLCVDVTLNAFNFFPEKLWLKPIQGTTFYPAPGASPSSLEEISGEARGTPLFFHCVFSFTTQTERQTVRSLLAQGVPPVWRDLLKKLDPKKTQRALLNRGPFPVQASLYEDYSEILERVDDFLDKLQRLHLQYLLKHALEQGPLETIERKASVKRRQRV